MALATAGRGRIGPNALIQTVAALRERHGQGADELLAASGFAHLLHDEPRAMVAEEQFRDLALALGVRLGVAEAGAVLGRAGELTAAYLLRRRIPAPARLLLAALPPRAALRLLLPAIARNAWTFGESGSFGFALGGEPYIRVSNAALGCTPAAAALVCRFYRGTFGGLLRALVSPQAALRETACQARGDAACVYAIQWSHQ
jgi:divinyl protochlorophyllide a 8-vinyl-reductase